MRRRVYCHYRGNVPPWLLVELAMCAGIFLAVPVFMGGCRQGGILSCQPDPNDPLQGRWTERASLSCVDGSETEASIGEIIFCQGEFAVTWTPFETYVDYWGVYVLDAATNQLTMTPTGGNYIPGDADLAGTVEYRADGAIALQGMFLGSKPTAGSAPVAACGHILEPQ